MDNQDTLPEHMQNFVHAESGSTPIPTHTFVWLTIFSCPCAHLRVRDLRSSYHHLRSFPFRCILCIATCYATSSRLAVFPAYRAGNNAVVGADAASVSSKQRGFGVSTLWNRHMRPFLCLHILMHGPSLTLALSCVCILRVRFHLACSPARQERSLQCPTRFRSRKH